MSTQNPILTFHSESMYSTVKYLGFLGDQGVIAHGF